MNKLDTKKFVFIFVSALLVFLSFHSIIWFTFTARLLASEPAQHIGDLARIGYQLPSAHIRTTQIKLPRQHIKASQWDFSPVDIITIGDSFSNGGGSGLNPYYQDYIASNSNMKVLNLNSISKEYNYIETIMAWYNSGLLQTVQPKAILIESIERSALGRFSVPINWDTNLSLADLKENISSRKWSDDAPNIPKPTLINTANYKFILYNLYYLFSDNALNYSHVYKRKTTKDLFTVKAKDTLLFYDQDLTSINLINKKNVEAMNNNFNILAQKLIKHNIKLYIMIAVDKYDLYQDYIVNNPYKENNFFPLIRGLDKDYTFIDTKSTLHDLVADGEKDIYFSDDTHWNYKASEAIFKDMHFK